MQSSKTCPIIKYHLRAKRRDLADVMPVSQFKVVI